MIPLQPTVPSSGLYTPRVFAGKKIPPFTGKNIVSPRKHNEQLAATNALLNIIVNPPTAGDVKYSAEGVMIDLSRFVSNDGQVSTIDIYNLQSVSSDYLTCVPVGGGSAVAIAKHFKLRQSLTSVTEFGTTWKFFYGDGSTTAQGSALFSALGITPDGVNVMRLKTSDGTQTAFPTTTSNTANTGSGGGYVRSMGELEMVLPVWTTTASSPNDIVFAASGNTGIVDGGGHAITLVDVGESRQWAKIDAAGPVFVGNFTNPNGNVFPSDPTTGNMYYQDGVANVWTWSVSGQNWFKVI